jgi:hypothetical protein
MCREPKPTMVSFLPLVLDQGSHKSYRVLGYRGCKNKNLGSTNAEARNPDDVSSRVKSFTIVDALGEKLKNEFAVSRLGTCEFKN